MRQIALGATVFATMAAAGYSQGFEVASIKPIQIQAGKPQPPAFEPTPGSLTLRNMGLMQAICWAYKIAPLQVANPQALPGDRFDFIAKAGRPATTDEMRVMLQALMAERFKLTMHRDTKEMTGYALVEAKGGHKLKESTDPDGPGVNPLTTKMALAGRKASLDLLTMFLAQPLRAPVADMTGLKGKYDFDLDISSYVPMDAPHGDDLDPVSILQAVLPKQLGLKLESRKIPVEMFTIEHVEKAPIEN